VADPARGRGEFPAALFTPERNTLAPRHPLIHLFNPDPVRSWDRREKRTMSPFPRLKRHALPGLTPPERASKGLLHRRLRSRPAHPRLSATRPQFAWLPTQCRAQKTSPAHGEPSAKTG